jgi:hypothetical protein
MTGAYSTNTTHTRAYALSVRASSLSRGPHKGVRILHYSSVSVSSAASKVTLVQVVEENFGFPSAV